MALEDEAEWEGMHQWRDLTGMGRFATRSPRLTGTLRPTILERSIGEGGPNPGCIRTIPFLLFAGLGTP